MATVLAPFRWLPGLDLHSYDCFKEYFLIKGIYYCPVTIRYLKFYPYFDIRIMSFLGQRGRLQEFVYISLHQFLIFQ